MFILNYNLFIFLSKNMAKHSEKKAKKIAQSANQHYLLFIFISTGIYLIMHLYQYYIQKREDIFTKLDILGFIFLSLANYFLYKLLTMFDTNQYLYTYIYDIFILNCLIEILINFSTKFWYLYLIYPAYFAFIGLKALYGYISNIGKGDEMEGNEETETNNRFKDSGHQTKQPKEKKQKVKYVKH